MRPICFFPKLTFLILAFAFYSKASAATEGQYHDQGQGHIYDQTHDQIQSQVYNQPTEIIEATPISVFAHRTGTLPISELPQDQFKDSSQPVSDQLNSVPGISARSNGSPTISIRGSVDADRVMKLYDGIPLNLADGVGGSDLFVPQESLASANLLKMPASVFYGGSAMRGAINFRTRIYDRDAVRVNMSDDTGVIGTRGIFAAAPFHLKDVNADASTLSHPNYQFTAFDEFAPGKFHYDSLNKVGGAASEGRLDHNWQETTRFALTGSSRIGKIEVTPHFIFARQLGESPGPITSPSRSSSEVQGSLGAIEAKASLGHGADLGVRLSDIRQTGKYDKGTSYASDSQISRTALTTDLDWAWRENVVSQLFFDFDLDHLSASYLGGSGYNQHIFEIGQSHEITFFDTWSVLLAQRYLSESGQNLKTITLADTLAETRLWASYAEGFRNPSLSDRFSSTSYFKGNPSLKPEQSQSIELGVSRQPPKGQSVTHEGFTYNASVYWIRDTNLMDTQPYNASAQTKVNLGHARTYGAEASLGYTYHVWSLTIADNTMDAMSEADSSHPADPLRLAPKNQLSLILSQQLGPVVMAVEDTYWSHYYDRAYPSNQLEELPAWNKVDLSFRTMGFTDWEMKCGILNIFNRPRELTLGYPEAQRSFYASALRYF